MPDTPTHAATASKLASARRRGDVVFTADWATAAVLVVTCLGAAYAGAAIWLGTTKLAQTALGGQLPSARESWLGLVLPLAGWLSLMPLAALLAVGVQRGFALRFGATAGRAAPLMAAVARPSPIDVLFGVVKLGLLAWLLIAAIRDCLPGVLDATTRTPTELLSMIVKVTRALVWRAVLALVLIGVGDFLLRRHRRLQRLRMSARELSDEQRELQGDPRLIGERRARAKALFAQASLHELADAQLVLTGAGRAVALRYRPDVDQVPALWLKAEGTLATQLLAQAHALELPVVEEPMLVDALYKLELTEPVAAALFPRLAPVFARYRARIARAP